MVIAMCMATRQFERECVCVCERGNLLSTNATPTKFAQTYTHTERDTHTQ